MSEHNANLTVKNVLIIGFCSFLIFLSSLLVNLLQLINYLTTRYINIDYYRYINACLQYVIYSRKCFINFFHTMTLAKLHFPHIFILFVLIIRLDQNIDIIHDLLKIFIILINLIIL